MVYIRNYAVTFLVFMLFDGLWLSQMVPAFYSVEMDGMMRSEMIWPAATLFYLLYTAAVLLLAVQPGLQTRRVGASLWRGALLGAAAYGTYNLTNYAVLEGWSLTLTIVDQVWGTVLGAATSGLSALVILRIEGLAEQQDRSSLPSDLH